MLVLLGNSLAPSLHDYFNQRAQHDPNLKILPASLGMYAARQSFAEVLGSVKGQDVVVIQSLGSVDLYSSDSFREETYQAIDVLKAEGAAKIHVINPYAAPRSDRKVDGRQVCVGVERYAKNLKNSGADSFTTIDIHSKAGFEAFRKQFGKATYDLSTTELFAGYIEQEIGADNLSVGGPDAGADERSVSLQERMKAEGFHFRKRHTGVNDTEVVEFDGDVAGRKTITVDDEVDTGGTIINAQKILKNNNTTERYVFAPHGVFSKGGLENLFTAGARGDRTITQIVITDSINPWFEIERLRMQYRYFDDIDGRIKVLSVGPLLYDHIQQNLMPKPTAEG